LCGAVALLWPLLALRHGREHYFLPYWYSFLLGVFLYWTRTGRMPRWLLALFVGGIAVAWGIHTDSLVGAALVTGVLMWIAGEKDRMQTWLHQRPLQFLGKISYSLYITHSPVIGAVYYAGTRAFGASERTELMLIGPEVVASLVVGTAAWWLVERPAVRWSKNLRRERVVVQAVAPA
jgi:peptidoglycan/LPS O-acetylase OafA/YrhL